MNFILMTNYDQGVVLAFFWDRNGANDYINFQTNTGYFTFVGNEGEGHGFASIYTGNDVIIAATRTYEEVLDTIDGIMAGSWKHYWFRGTVTDHGVEHIDGQDIHDAGGIKNYMTTTHSETVSQLATTGDINFAVAVKGTLQSDIEEPTDHIQSLCNNSLITLKWDLVDDVDIYLPLADAWYEVATGITSQAELITWLEAVYPDDNYLIGYHVTTGDICIEWQDQVMGGLGTGGGSVTYSADLSENIILEDEVEAYVIAAQKRNRESWLGGVVKS
jgi:hypothetical protein